MKMFYFDSTKVFGNEILQAVDEVEYCNSLNKPPNEKALPLNKPPTQKLIIANKLPEACAKVYCYRHAGTVLGQGGLVRANGHRIS